MFGSFREDIEVINALNQLPFIFYSWHIKNDNISSKENVYNSKYKMIHILK